MEKSSKKPPKVFVAQQKCLSLHRFYRKHGRLAQLVQSICLTSRGSAVRIRQRPQQIKESQMRLLYLLWALTDEFSFLANAKANAKVSVLNSVNALAS